MRIKLLQKKLKTKSLMYITDGHLRIQPTYLKYARISVNLSSLKLSIVVAKAFNPYLIQNGKLWLEKISNKYEREKMLFMWEKLEALIKTKKISSILKYNDKIKNPFSCYRIKDGKVLPVLLRTSKYPFIDLSGNLIPDDIILYNTEQNAIKEALLEEKSAEKLASKSLTTLTQSVLDASVARNKHIANINSLRKLLKRTRSKPKTIKPKAK